MAEESNNLVRKIVDHSGNVYHLVAVIPGVNVNITMLSPGSEPSSEATVAADGTVTIDLKIPSAMGIKNVEVSEDGIITITLDDNSTTVFDGMQTIITTTSTAAETAAAAATAADQAVATANETLDNVQIAANNIDNAFRGVAQYLPVGMGNVVTAELDGTDSELVSVSDAFKNGKLLGAKVYGKSTQVVTTGKNLLDANNLVWFPGIRDGNGNVDTSQSGGAHYTNEIAVSPNTEYTLSGTLRIPNSVYRLYYLDSNKEWISRTSGLDNFEYYTFITPSNCGFIQIQVQISISLSDAQLELGSTATDYEPYTGGAPSPSPDYPQEIESVTEGDLKLTGKCIWGGEQMADDIVAAFDNSDLSWKGEDSNGRYVAVKATSTPVIFFKIKKVFNIATLVLKIRKTTANKPTNFALIRQDSSVATLTLASDAIIGEVQKVAFVRDNIIGVRNSNGSSIAYIYYDESGLFEGTLTVDDFVPYAGDALHFLPDDVEPLRSLPDGTRDVLTIDANGNGVIERNVKKVIINGETRFLFEDGNRIAYITGHDNDWMRRTDDYRLTMIANTLPSNKSHTRAAQLDRMAITGYYSPSSYPGQNWIYVSDIPSELQTSSALSNFFAQHETEVLCALATPTIEIIPASRMPKVPSQYLHAWLEAKDQNGEEIVTDYSVYYEKSIGALLSQIEQALDAAGYPITDYEPEDAMSVAPVLSNDANPVTDAQMAAAVTYGFTLN